MQTLVKFARNFNLDNRQKWVVTSKRRQL